MAIITIYQGASGSGEELAGAVAQSLGCACVGRELLVRTSQRYGLSEAKLNQIDEAGPSWWERFVQNLQPYRIALQAALCEIAEAEGDAGLVYHGHLGHELLPNFNHVIKVMMTAPLEMRVEQVQERQRLDANAARRYVDEVDKARSRRLRALFDQDWRDPSRFDLVINRARMSLDAAQHLIVAMARLPEFKMNPASKQAFADFTLASRVHAALALSSEIAQSNFDIKAQAGKVAVKGVLPTWLSEELVVDKIKQVPGVKNVEADFVSAPDIIYGD